MQIFRFAQKFIADGDVVNQLNSGKGKDDLAAVVKEMVETMKETGGDEDKITAMVEGWISMEENEACINELADEVHKLMDVNVLLKKDADEGSDGENESAVEVKRVIPTHDEVADVCSQLKSISVQVSQFTQDYGKTAEDINDACNRLRETHQRMENKRRARANKTPRQSFMDSFVRRGRGGPRGDDGSVRTT